MAHRHELTDEQWSTLVRALPKRKGPESVIGDRAFINANLYRAKTGCPWRDLPERYGPWKTVYNRFNRWSHSGIWAKVLKALRRSKKPRLDRKKYRKRYRVEVFFHDIKRFRAVATRFEKRARHYLSVVQLVSALLWLAPQDAVAS